MEKIRIKSKASSANLGIGFDFLGLGLNIYNITEFEIGDEFKFINFDDVKNNLIYNSYIYFFDKFNLKPVPVLIEQKERNIPLSRGLGSSASAIVTGVLAANYYSKLNLSEIELLEIMNEIEGHPDNISASLYGGLISTIIDENKINVFKNKISQNLNFYIFIPPYEVKTSDARKILKDSLTYSETTFNCSRAFMAKEALEKGDINLLKICLKDIIHEPYRKTLIKDYEYFENLFKNDDVVLKISGSGSTLIFITDKVLNDERLIKVEVDNESTKVEVL